MKTRFSRFPNSIVFENVMNFCVSGNNFCTIGKMKFFHLKTNKIIDEFVLKKAREQHAKRSAKLLKKGEPAEPFHLRSKDGAFLTILPPILHNLKIKKPSTRKVFTFKGIQSSKGVTHHRETGLVYNNVCPDVNRKTGLIIPKTLVKAEKRPKKQLKTSRHKRK